MDVKGPADSGGLGSSERSSRLETEPEGQAPAGASTEREFGESSGGLTVNSDLIELLRVMPRVFRGLRRVGEHAAEPTGATGATGATDPTDATDAATRDASIKALFKGGALGPRHIPVLIVLVLEGPHTVGDLAHRLGLNLATVSLMAGELAKAGLVERREDERDRRRTLVSIPDEQCWRLAPFVNQRISPVRRALERMSPEVREAFLAGWRVLADEIDRGSAGAGPEAAENGDHTG